MNENRPHVPIKEKLTKFASSKTAYYMAAPFVIALVIGWDVSRKGGWAIKKGDVENGLISAVPTILFVLSVMYLVGRLSSKGKKKIPKD